MYLLLIDSENNKPNNYNPLVFIVTPTTHKHHYQEWRYDQTFSSVVPERRQHTNSVTQHHYTIPLYLYMPQTSFAELLVIATSWL